MCRLQIRQMGIFQTCLSCRISIDLFMLSRHLMIASQAAPCQRHANTMLKFKSFATSDRSMSCHRLPFPSRNWACVRHTGSSYRRHPLTPAKPTSCWNPVCFQIVCETHGLVSRWVECRRLNLTCKFVGSKFIIIFPSIVVRICVALIYIDRA
jgi:hypothetical protein